MRSEIALVLLIALSLGGCDRPSGKGEQGAPGNAAAGGSTSANAAAPISDEVPAGAADAGGGEAFKHTIDRSHKGEAPPADSFTAPDSKPATLAALAGGKPLLVNLWATWCAPCVAELPALARLAADHPAIRLVTVSQDAETGLVAPFLAKKGLTTLTRYLDPENKLGFAYATGVLPTTILYDGKGKEVLRVVGALDWAGADGRAILAEAR